MIFLKSIKIAFKRKEGYILGKYFKSEWKYFSTTKTYIYYIVWVASAMISTVLGHIQQTQFSSVSNVTLTIIISLFNAGLSLTSLIAPLVIIILYVQSITNVFTEGAYRNVFSLSISRVKWLASKTIIYVSLYLGVIILLKSFNELMFSMYSNSHPGIMSFSSLFVYNNLLVTLLVFLVEVALILMYHGLATWLAVSFRKTVPVVLIIIFGTILMQIVSGIILIIVTSSVGYHVENTLLAYPIPGNFYGFTSLVYVNINIGVVYLNLVLTILFQLGYAVLFYFLGCRKINRLDF